MIYSIAAINNVSWGTRDGTKKAEKKDKDENKLNYARKLMAKMMFWKKTPADDTTETSALVQETTINNNAQSMYFNALLDNTIDAEEGPTEEEIKADPFKFMLGRREQLD